MPRKTLRKQHGGSKKYILLSCPEFNHVVDNIIGFDAGLTFNGSAVQTSDADPLINPLTEFDSKTDDINEEGFKKFLCEINSCDDEKPEDYKKYLDGAKRQTAELLYNRERNTVESNNYYRGFINWKSYKDSTPDIKMNKNTVTKLRGAKIIYLAYFSFNELGKATSMIDQFLFLNSLNHYGVAEINIILPYFPVGTMERIVGEGEIPSAYSLAHMLNSVPEGTSKNNLYMFDIHALCSRFFFHTNTRPILISMMTEYIDFINAKYPETGTDNYNVVVFPDDGAKKRFGSLLPKTFKKILCAKTRLGDKRIVKIESGFDKLITGIEQGKTLNLFVIDDLVQSGGTILETFDGIKKTVVDSKTPSYNESKINYISIVTHSVFPSDEDLAKYFSLERGSDKAKVHSLITTNSRPFRTDFIQKTYGDRVQVVDIANSLRTIFNDKKDTKYITPYSIH